MAATTCTSTLAEPQPTVLTLDVRAKHPMKKQIAVVIASGTLTLAAPASQTFTGIITDDLCGNADHKAMNMGVDEKCVT